MKNRIYFLSGAAIVIVGCLLLDAGLIERTAYAIITFGSMAVFLSVVNYLSDQ